MSIAVGRDRDRYIFQDSLQSLFAMIKKCVFQELPMTCKTGFDKKSSGGSLKMTPKISVFAEECFCTRNELHLSEEFKVAAKVQLRD